MTSFRAILEEGRRQQQAALAEERAAREAQFVAAQEVCRRVTGRRVFDWIAESWSRAMRAVAPGFDLPGSDGEKNDKSKDENKPDGPPPPPRRRRRWRRRGHGAIAESWDAAAEPFAGAAEAAAEAGSRLVVPRPGATGAE